MATLHELMNRLRVGEVRLSSTKCLSDRDAGLLNISGWLQCLTGDVVIAFTIVDETDQLEWTCMIKSVPYRRLADESFQVKIPSASVEHRFVVTTKVLRGISNTNGDTADVDCYEVTSKSSCTARMSTTSVPGIASLPVLDVRPRLRSNAGIAGANGDMLSMLTAGSLLPTKKSQSFSYAGGDSVELQIYQGDSRRISRNKRVHAIELELQSVELKKTVTLSLDVSEDGTLTTVVEEQDYSNANATVAPRIIDVVCPKIAIDIRDPELRVEWTRTIVKKAVLDISTTYTEIHRWLVSIAATGVATSSCGHLFIFPRDGFSQRFNIPSNFVEAGVSYEVTVEGLQEIHDRVVHSFSNFRIICRNSATLKPIAVPARTSIASSRMRSSPSDYPKVPVEPMFGFSFQRSSTSQVNLDFGIEIERSTFHQASVLISINRQAAQANRKWRISVNKIARTAGPVYYSLAQTFDKLATGNRQRFDFPLQFEAGSSYRVTVAPMEWSGGIYQNPDNSVERTADFRAELTLEDIKALYRMAVQRAAGYGSSDCHWLYRNKSRQYFENIRLNRGGIMEVYLKDNSGDPASPINLQIKGLFFMASVERGTTRGEPMRVSPFGPLRICIPAEELLAKAPNVYFVDFYCMRGQNHQVTLVITRPGSETDIFCAERLLLLNLNKNPFFFRDATGQLRVSTRDQLLVELLFTEDLDVSGYSLKQVLTVGRGSSTPGGIPKNAMCAVCNLPRRTSFTQF